MISLFVAVVISSALGYFLGWLLSEYISYRKLLKQESKISQHLKDNPLSPYYEFDVSDYLDNWDDLDDEYYHHDEEYYKNNSDFVIIEKEDEQSYFKQILQNVYENMLEKAMIQDIENDNKNDIDKSSD